MTNQTLPPKTQNVNTRQVVTVGGQANDPLTWTESNRGQAMSEAELDAWLNEGLSPAARALRAKLRAMSLEERVTLMRGPERKPGPASGVIDPDEDYIEF